MGVNHIYFSNSSDYIHVESKGNAQRVAIMRKYESQEQNKKKKKQEKENEYEQEQETANQRFDIKC